MEVILLPPVRWKTTFCFLHVCGGDLQKASCWHWLKEFSPRMWRWSSINHWWPYQRRVFSTYVEVIPVRVTATKQTRLFSPRMWRWSYIDQLAKDEKLVFSTYVEVILNVIFCPSLPSGFLHVCGGDPGSYYLPPYLDKFSPRMWRWSNVSQSLPLISFVFSTYVEVILNLRFHGTTVWSFLHVCGGDPRRFLSVCLIQTFSPRMWRWSSRGKNL